MYILQAKAHQQRRSILPELDLRLQTQTTPGCSFEPVPINLVISCNHLFLISLILLLCLFCTDCQRRQEQNASASPPYCSLYKTTADQESSEKTVMYQNEVNEVKESTGEMVSEYVKKAQSQS